MKHSERIWLISGLKYWRDAEEESLQTIKNNYHNFPVCDIIRDERSGRYGRSFVLLVFLDNEISFSGYFLNPYSKAEEKFVFAEYAEFENEVIRLSQHIENLDEKDLPVICYSDWLPADLTVHAAFVVHLMVTMSGNWMGTVYNPLTNEERNFTNKIGLRMLLAS